MYFVSVNIYNIYIQKLCSLKKRQKHTKYKTKQSKCDTLHLYHLITVKVAILEHFDNVYNIFRGK